MTITQPIKVNGDSRKMSEIHDGSVHPIVTSPPYWQLKDYGSEDQIGFNDSYGQYINNLNLVWKECFRILHEGCRLCINIGDPCSGSGTSSMVAKALERNSIGYEINAEFFPLIKDFVGSDNRFLFSFKRNVGATSESIRKCAPKSVEQWREYYYSNVKNESEIEELGKIIKSEAYKKFSSKYGGNEFYVFSQKENGKKKIANKEVIEAIREEMNRLKL